MTPQCTINPVMATRNNNQVLSIEFKSTGEEAGKSRQVKMENASRFLSNAQPSGLIRRILSSESAGWVPQFCVCRAPAAESVPGRSWVKPIQPWFWRSSPQPGFRGRGRREPSGLASLIGHLCLSGAPQSTFPQPLHNQLAEIGVPGAHL